MSLTLPSAYSSASKQGNIQENWIVQLYYDGGSSFTPISLADTTVDSTFYHGVITNVPSIRSSIDLVKSTAKTGNISLSVVNFQYKGDDFSAELLFHSSRKYINRNVKIYSQLNGETTLSDCLQIYQGRLIDISHTDDSIKLTITEQRPWDFISIPNTRTVNTNNDRGAAMYFPVVYGDFSANVSTESAPALCYPEVAGQGASLFPIPVHKYDTNEFTCLMPGTDTGNSSNSTNSATPHWYEKNIDSFVPLLNSAGNTYDDNTESYQNGNAVKAPLDLFRSFRFKPEKLDTINEFTNNPYNGFDTSSGASSTAINTSTASNYSAQSFTPTAGSASIDTDNLDAVYNIPQIDGKVTSVKLGLGGYSVINGSASAGTLSCAMKYHKLDASAYTTMATNSTASTDETTLGFDGSTTGVATHTTADIVSQISDGQLPSIIRVRNSLTWNYGNLNDGRSNNNMTGYVSDIQFIIKTKLAFDTDNISGSIAKLDAVEIMYSGGDGLSNSFSGGTGLADTGLEAHRDMLTRYAGWDDADADIYNWDSGLDVENARITTAWNISWWALEPIALKDVLEQLQYEFGFWFKWRNDGTGSYWVVKDSYSSSDVVQTLNKSDITNLSVSTTPFSELLTKMDIQYKRHPAENSRYLLNVTSEDTTNDPRSDWNIQTKENIKEIKLDMNINKPGNTNPGGGDPNDGFADYYMNIFGDIKKIINCEIVNPSKGYNLETGDIVQFSDVGVDPFGHSWTESGAQYYMITDLQRSPGKIKIQAREVG